MLPLGNMHDNTKNKCNEIHENRLQNQGKSRPGVPLNRKKTWHPLESVSHGLWTHLGSDFGGKMEPKMEPKNHEIKKKSTWK